MKKKQTTLKEKQLRQKLENIHSTKQLKQIYINLEKQNNTLREDTLQLKYKVDLLMSKQKAKQAYTAPEDADKLKQLRITQLELKQQFAIMIELKKHKESVLSEKGTEQLKSQHTNIMNQMRTVDTHLESTKIAADDLKKQSNRLSKTLALYDEEGQRNKPKIDEYESENNNLRKKIFSLRKLQNEKEYQSSKIMNSMYSFKTKMNKNKEIERSLSTQKLPKSTTSIGKHKSQQIDTDSLLREVNALKEEVHRRQQEYNKLNNLNTRKKLQLLAVNRQITAEQKQLDDKKGRLQRELNKHKRIWEKYIEYKNNSKYLKQFIESPMQADEYVDEGEPLRKEFAGILGGKIRFDDRHALKLNKRSYMIGFMVYQLENNVTSRNNLVALRAIYDDAEASANNQIPLPGQYLSKCKLTKYVMMEGDFIKLFKIKYQSNDSRILKIQIRTNKNSRYEFGDRKPFSDLSPGQNVYGFDISLSEYPVCLFGSYNMMRSHWYLQSLGVEINDLAE